MTSAERKSLGPENAWPKEYRLSMIPSSWQKQLLELEQKTPLSSSFLNDTKSRSLPGLKGFSPDMFISGFLN
jgi:hypothetical protein